MKFRQATLSDLSRLNSLVNGAYRGESSRQGWTTEADLLDGIRTTESSLREQLQKPDAIIVIAEDDKDIQGCVYLEKQEEVLYLGMLTVVPNGQGKGLGAQLVQEAENWAIKNGCNRIRITVIDARDTLIAWYQRKGFQSTGVVLPFPDDPKFGIPKQPLQFTEMEKILNA